MYHPEKPREYPNISVRLDVSETSAGTRHRIEHRAQDHGLIGNLHTAALVCSEPRCPTLYLLHSATRVHSRSAQTARVSRPTINGNYENLTSQLLVEQLCLPYFDSPSVFARILDKDKGGHWSICPTTPFSTKQAYLPSSNARLLPSFYISCTYPTLDPRHKVGVNLLQISYSSSYTFRFHSGGSVGVVTGQP